MPSKPVPITDEMRKAITHAWHDLGSKSALADAAGVHMSMIGKWEKKTGARVARWMEETTYQALLPYIGKYINEQVSESPDPQKTNKRRWTDIPVRQLAVFGTGNAADYSTGYVMGDVVPDNDHVLDRIVTTQTNAVAAFRVEGDSMSGSDIADGDYVVCGPPGGFLAVWTHLRYNVRIVVVEIAPNQTKVSVRSHIEGYENNVARGWHVLPSNGRLEGRILDAIGRDMAPALSSVDH